MRKGDFSDASTIQGMPKIAEEPPELERGKASSFPYRFQREHGLANTLTLDF